MSECYGFGGILICNKDFFRLAYALEEFVAALRHCPASMHVWWRDSMHALRICFGGICGCSVIAQRVCMHGGGVRCMHCGVVRPLVHRGSVWFFEYEVRVDP